MKIFFVTEFFPSTNSSLNTGGTIFNYSFIRLLAQRFDVSVLSFDPSSKSSDFNENFSVVCEPRPSWRGIELSLNWNRYVQKAVANQLKKIELPSLILATTSTLMAFEVVATETRKVAIVQAYENFGACCPYVPFRQKINLLKQAATRRFCDSRFLRSADAVFTNSEFMRSAISSRFKIFRSNIYVLPQEINIDLSPDIAEVNSIGFVSRGRDKGIDFIIKLALKAPDLCFMVYGHSIEIPKNLPSNIKVQGWESNRSRMFASARLWIMPSVWAEPFGRVSVEAQAAGRAVLVADHGGLSETIIDPLFTIRGFQIDQWLQRIRLLLKMPRDSVSRNSRDVRVLFSSDKFSQRTLSCVNRVMSS